jgi:hypothetical protein
MGSLQRPRPMVDFATIQCPIRRFAVETVAFGQKVLERSRLRFEHLMDSMRRD